MTREANAFGRYVRDRIASQAELSRRTGYSEKYLSQILLGVVARPSPGALIAIARAMRLDPYELARIESECAITRELHRRRHV